MKNFRFNEFLFALYIYLFAFLKVITTNLPQYSTHILFICVLVIVIISFLYNKLKIKTKFLFTILIILLVLFIDFGFRRNTETASYIYNFIIYGGVTIYLYSNIKDIKQVLYYFSHFSVVIFLMYFIDPFIDYNYTTNYMVFGYDFMLPAFAGLYIGRKYLNITWMRIFELVALIELIVFANKGAALAAIFLVFVLSFIYNKVNNKNYKTWLIRRFLIYIIGLFGLFVLWVEALSIIDYISNIVEKFGFNSYSLITLKAALVEKNIDSGLSGRDLIWQNAESFISNNNLLIGSGTSAFHSFYGTYPHNIFLDILTSYGLIGLVIIIILCLRSLKVIIKSCLFEKIFGLMILSLWCVPLSFSMSFIESREFWIFVFIGIGNTQFFLKRSERCLANKSISMESYTTKKEKELIIHE